MQNLQKYADAARAIVGPRANWSTQAIAESVAEFTVNILPATHVFVSELTDSGRGFLFRAAVGLEKGKLFAHERITAEQADTMSLLSKDVFVVDAENRALANRISSMLGGWKIASGASVPIHNGRDAWGVLGAYSDRSPSFDKSKLFVLTAVAGHLGRMVRRIDAVEARIAAAKQDWEATVDALSQLVLVLDTDGRVIRTNRAVEAWGCGKVGCARGQHVCDLLKHITRCRNSGTVFDWPGIKERLAVERLLEWELEQRPRGRAFRLSLRVVSSKRKQQQNGAACYAVLVIDDVTGLKTARDAEKQLHVLSCQLMDAQEMERKKIAAELHDGIGQIMGAVKFQLENLIGSGGRGPRLSWCNQLKKAVENVQDAMEEVRKIAMNLRPSTLDDLGLLVTIDWFCREFCNMYTGIRVEKRLAVNESALTDEHKIVIYRIMQEAMNNIAKYANASAVHLELSTGRGGLHLRIHDNGQGFDTARLTRASCFEGFGLRTMRERAELTGGVFAVESKRGEGTTVHVRWPKGSASKHLLGD